MFDKSVKKLLRLTIPMFALMVVLSIAPGNKTYAAEDASTSDSEIVTVAENEGSVELASDTNTTESTEETEENADVEVASETATVAASTADFDSMGIFFFLIGIGVGAIAIVSFREYMIEK